VTLTCWPILLQYVFFTLGKYAKNNKKKTYNSIKLYILQNVSYNFFKFYCQQRMACLSVEISNVYQKCPNIFRQRATDIIVVWFADRMCTNHSMCYKKSPNYCVFFIVHVT
jgi:hypothetical protein